MRIIENVQGLVGNTPLYRPTAFLNKRGVKANILVKLEGFNPGGSIKDRVAFGMVKAAEASGALRPGMTILEPTSGNTGIGLAIARAVFGYETVIVMPDTMSVERQRMMKAYGARLVLTPGAEGMNGAVKKAASMAAESDQYFIPSQFDNPVNADTHEQTTAEEIWRDTDGTAEVLVAGIGTGGTITGIGRALKAKRSDFYVVAVEPADSPLLSDGRAGAHKIQGIGANFVPTVLDRTVYDEVVTAGFDEAVAATRDLARTEGVLVGISAGAALASALHVASRPDMEGKTIIVILPDDGGRYLSTGIFDE